MRDVVDTLRCHGETHCLVVDRDGRRIRGLITAVDIARRLNHVDLGAAPTFAEIFAGNCTALGLPCVTLAKRDLDALMDSVELDPTQEVGVDVEARTVTSRAGVMTAGVPDGTRTQLLDGTWDATAQLLSAGSAIEDTAAALPYLRDFAE